MPAKKNATQPSAKAAPKKGGAKKSTPSESAPVTNNTPVVEAVAAPVETQPAAPAPAPVVAPAPVQEAAPVVAAPTVAAETAPKKGGAKKTVAKKAAAKKTVAKKTAKKAVSTKKTVAKKTVAKKAAKKAPVAKKGGAKSVEVAAAAATTESAGSKTRFFKVAVGDEKPHGRFSGKKPKQAANKALTSILNARREAGADTAGKIKFRIEECTRNSKHKTYRYIGERAELDEPMTVKIGDENGKEKEIVYKYSNKVTKDREATPAKKAAKSTSA